ncbi:hypothetical protein PVL29_020444 [Vitis rotundifolia]|uniref:Uncharacterized protein n=1 Tax=Vitis rotundifolia TaxID=103349 RepID=A0AA39DGR1_VITRO|nr:hypothetical protein PVL29_020444 [Vitis rotundifolia]
MSNEILNNSAKLERATKILAAVSALVIGAVIHGVISLERMETVFRLKEGLDVIQFILSTRSNSNGNPRSLGAFKVDNSVEVCVHWFRLLIGNCKTVCDGLVVDLMGEPSIVALLRMQRTLPLNLVFPPAYSIFSFVVWRPFILNANITNREDIHQLYQSLTLTVSDAIKHLPFRDVCMRDTHGFYDLVAADASDSEFAAMLELNGPDLHLRAMAFVPLRARLFLNAIIDCKMPNTSLTLDDVSWVSGHAESKVPYAENETKLLDKLVHILDTMQPAKFHWQWVELRLLLNEQALVEKLDNHDVSLAEAIHSISSNPEKAVASENENNFILTRLLVWPYAAALFQEVVHLFGRSLEDSTLLQAKWIFVATKGDKKKFEVTSLEEGEVVEEGTDSKRYGKGSTQMSDFEGFIVSQQHATERALVELVLPCIDQSSDDSRNAFASDLTKLMHIIEQQINTVTRGTTKQAGTVLSGVEGPANKGNNRKGMRGGSPGLARRPTGVADSAPPSPAALRASMALRLQFLLRLLPIICAEGLPTSYWLTNGFFFLFEGATLSNTYLYLYSTQSPPSKREAESLMEASTAASLDLSGESLFDRLLLVVHGLLSSCQPSWLKSKPASKSTTESIKEFSGFDREGAENLQPPSVSSAALASLQPSLSFPAFHPGNTNQSQRNSSSLVRPGKLKNMPLQQDHDIEIDPWTLLEDGAGAGPSSGNTAVIGSGDHANLRASSWLRGTVRMRRTDLTYIGAVDDDS